MISKQGYSDSSITANFHFQLHSTQQFQKARNLFEWQQSESRASNHETPLKWSCALVDCVSIHFYSVKDFR